MITRRKIRQILRGVLGVVAITIGLVLSIPEREPVARIPLSDGTELRLEDVTYGTQHRTPGSNALVVGLTRFAQHLPGLGIPLHVREYVHSSTEPELLLWFSHYDPRSRKFLSTRLNDLFVQLDDDGGVHRDAHIVSASPMMPRPNTNFVVSIFSRRSEDLHLHVAMGGEAFVFAVPNPAAKISFPEWTAEPLPQTRRVGELDVVLHSFSILGRDHPRPSFSPRYQILHQGKEASGLAFQTKLIDATGNVGTRGQPPSLTERAWKVQSVAHRTARYPFTDHEQETLGPARMPGPGQYTVLNLSEEAQAQGFRMAILVEPGPLQDGEGVFVAAGDSRADSEAAAFLTSLRLERSSRHKVRDPMLVLLFCFPNDATAETKWMERYRNKVVRLRWDGQLQGLWTPEQEWRCAVPMFGSMIGISDVYRLSGINEESQEITPPLPGQPVTIQIAPVKPETIEFFVEPPKLIDGGIKGRP